MKTQYRIKRSFNGWVIYSYLQFKDNNGIWRYVPSRINENINGQSDCYSGEINPIICDYIKFEYKEQENEFKDFINNYPNIDKYISFLIKERKEKEFKQKELKDLFNKRKKYVENNEYVYLN